jgi:hypothetical protein
MIFNSQEWQRRERAGAKWSHRGADRVASRRRGSHGDDPAWQDQQQQIRSQRRRLMASFLVGVAMSTSPCHGGAFPLLVAQMDESTSPPPFSGGAAVADSYGTPLGSSPYFNSASAARLLVNPTPTNRGSPEARKQLARQERLQDARLEQCFEAGIDWEQCFYYGTNRDPKGLDAPMTFPDFDTYASSQSSMATMRSASKARVPTW